MALEAQEVAVRVRLVGGSAFKKEADGVAGSLAGIGKAGKEANAGLAGTLANTHKVLSATGTKLQKVGNEARNTGRTMMMASIPLVALGYYSAKAATDFSTNMSLLQRQANVSAKEVKFLTQGVMDMADKVATTPNELALGLYNISSSNVHGKQALLDLKVAAMGANSGIDTLTNTTNALMGVMNTKLKDTKSPGTVMAMIDALVGQGKMKLPELLSAFSSEIVPLAKDAGLGFKDVGAAMAAMTRLNIPAQREANLMKLTLTKMFAPEGQGLTALQRLGFDQFSLADDMRKPRGLLTALTDLHNHLKGLSKNDQMKDLADIFGKSRGIGNIASLLNNLSVMRQILGVADNASMGTLRRHFLQAMHTPQGQMNRLKANVQKDLIDLGNKILPMLIPLLKRFTDVLGDVVKWFDKLPHGLQRTIFKLSALFILLGPAVYMFGSLLTVFGSLLKVGGFLAKIAFPGLEAESASLGLAFSGLLGPIALVAAAMIALGGPKKIKDSIKSNIRSFTDQYKHPSASRNAHQHLFNMVNGNPNKNGSMPLLGMMAHGAVHLGASAVSSVLDGAKAAKHFFDSIPGLATGGRVNMGGMALVGEAGPELLSLPRGARVDPLPHLTGALTEPVMASLAGSLQGAWQITVDSPVYLDGQLIGRRLDRVHRQEANRR